MVDSVPIHLLPEAFVLQRWIGEKHNDPALLEEKDFKDFYAKFQGGPSFAFGQMRNLTFYEMGERIQENRFSPKPYNSDYLLMLRGAFHAIQFVSELASQDEACDQISPEDITALTAVMGDEAAALVRSMEETFATAQQGVPYVFSDTESFGDFSDVSETVDLLEGLVPEILSEYSRRFGLPDVLPAPPIGGITVYYSEEAEEGQLRLPEMIVEVGVHPLLVIKYGDTHLLRHELNHLWVALSLGGSPFCWARAVTQFEVMRWQGLLEGLATYATGDQSARRNDVFANHSPVQLANFINSISTNLFDRHPYYFFPTLLVEMWVEEHGELFMGELMDEVVRNGWGDAMRNLLLGEQNFSDYIAGLQQRATAKIREMYSDEELESYAGILETILPGIRQVYESESLRGVGCYPQVAVSLEQLTSAESLLETNPENSLWIASSVLCDNFLEKYPAGVFSPAVRYLAGVLHYRLGNGEKAREHFSEILKDPFQFINRAEEAIFYSAVAEARWGEEGVTALDDIIPYLNVGLRNLAEEVKKELSRQQPPQPSTPAETLEPSPPRLPTRFPTDENQIPISTPPPPAPQPRWTPAEEEGGCNVNSTSGDSLRQILLTFPRRR